MQYFYHQCDISRLTSTGEGISKTQQALYTGVHCQIQPLDNSTAVANGWDFGQGYMGFFDDDQDIQKGDKVTFNGMSLIVQGIKDFASMPILSHKEVIMQKEES